jgi:hypothetical protein
MAEKGETKIVAIVTILIILFLIGFSGCFKEDGEEKEIDYYYNIKLSPSINKSFYIYLPVPIVSEGNISKITDLLTIKSGSGSYSFIETKFGFAINLSSNNNIELELKGNKFKDIKTKGDVPHIYLSLDNDLDNDGDKTEWDDSYVQYYIFFNSTKIQFMDFTILFSVHSEPYDFEGEVKLEGRLYNGWQLINGTMNASMD